MRAVGTVAIEDGRFRVRCEPQVMLRLKRVFGQVEKSSFGYADLSDTAETAHDLLWFMDRYPLELDKATRDRYLLRQATGIAKAPYVAAFVRLLVESGERVVLYGWHHEVYRLWAEQLRQFNPVFFTGRETVAQKERALQKFLSGDTPVIILSLRAGAGLDGLQQASRTVVFGELDWSPGVHEQCIGRVHRDGQQEPVMAYFLVADVGSDPIVADVLGLKTEQSEAIRDPDAELVEKLQVDPQHIRRLAESYLMQRGLPVTSPQLVHAAEQEALIG